MNGQKKYFSRTYYPALQNKVNNALKEGNLELALEAMKKFPNQETKIMDMSTEEIIKLKADHLVTLVEGYKAIAHAYVKALEDYRILGTFDEIKKAMDFQNSAEGFFQ